MNNSKLPVEIKSRGRNFNLLALMALVLAVVLFVAKFPIWAGLFLTVSLVVFFARRLVNNSLALTDGMEDSLSGTEGRLLEIKRDVSKAKFLEKVEPEGARLAQQGERLMTQYKNLKKILGERFNTTEMTYSRYMDGVDNACLSIAENLQNIKNLLENTNLNPVDSERQRAMEMMNMTDQALESMTTLFNSLNNIQTKEQHRDQLEESMSQIKLLAERAKSYSKV